MKVIAISEEDTRDRVSWESGRDWATEVRAERLALNPIQLTLQLGESIWRIINSHYKWGKQKESIYLD